MAHSRLVGLIITIMTIVLIIAGISDVTAPIIAQEDDACTTLVTEAFQVVGTACAEMGRNEACYGHIELDATFRNDPLPFANSGDLADIIQLESLTTAPLDLENDIWGIALMLVQADLPDAGDSTMTFLLMGDTQIQSAVDPSEDLPTCTATNSTANNLNIRRLPDTNSDIVGTIPPNSEVRVDGKNAESDWLHIISDDTAGWVFADLLTLDCETDTLATLDPATETFAPMQAFTLQTNPAGTCETVPDGLLIRSPEGQRARVVVNGVELVFSSVGYLTTPTDDLLSIQGLDGQIEVTSDSQTETIPSDFYTTVPLANLQADGPPALPQPVSDEQMVLLPIFDLATDTLIDHDIGIQVCSITASDTVNLRDGPGTNYPITGQLTDSDSISVAGQAEGDDGFVWWQLENNVWVRSDLVSTFGLCAAIPVVTPPPLPTPDPNSPTGGSFVPEAGSWRYVETIVESGCGETGGQLIYDDMRLTFSADYSTMTETSTTGPYFTGGMSITYTRSTGMTYIFNHVGDPYDNMATLTFTSATTAIGESYFPPGPNSCGTRWQIVATKN